LTAALGGLSLLAPCRLVMSGRDAAEVRCEQEKDADAVRGVLDRFGALPSVPGDATWLVIDLTPTTSGDALQVASHRTDRYLEH